jgi:hypothetical protein
VDYKVSIEFADEELTMRVTPEFIKKHLKSVEGVPCLDYDDGEDLIELKGSYEEIMVTANKVERERDRKRI